MEAQRPPSTKKMIKIATLAIGIFILLGGGIWGYYLVSPTITKYLALKDLRNIESGKFQGRLAVKGAGGSVDGEQSLTNMELKLLLDGYFDGKEMKSDFVAKMEAPPGYISPELNVKTFGDKVYLMLTKFPLPEAPGQPKLQDTWYFFESEEDKKTPQESQRIEQKEQKKDISRYISDMRMFKTFRKISNERVDGVDCKQYGFDIDIPKLSDVLVRAFSENGMLMTEGEKAKLKKSMDEIKSMRGSVLIGEKDKTIHRLDIYTETREASIDTTLKMFEINQKHAFEEPGGAKSLKDTFNIKDQPLPIFPSSDSARPAI